MIKDEYTIENDYPLMESINHYAKISNNDDYRYCLLYTSPSPRD